MQNDHFVDAYRQSRRTILEDTVSKLQALAQEATEALRRNLHCEIPSVEIRAAQIIIEQSIKGLEAIGAEERIDALEYAVKRIEEDYEQIQYQT